MKKVNKNIPKSKLTKKTISKTRTSAKKNSKVHSFQVDSVEVIIGGKKLEPSPLDIQVGGSHYKKLKIQPIVFCMENNLGPCESAIVKYISRWQDKGGIQDIDKVIHYAQILKEHHSKKDVPNG